MVVVVVVERKSCGKRGWKNGESDEIGEKSDEKDPTGFKDKEKSANSGQIERASTILVMLLVVMSTTMTMMMMTEM